MSKSKCAEGKCAYALSSNWNTLEIVTKEGLSLYDEEELHFFDFCPNCGSKNK